MKNTHFPGSERHRALRFVVPCARMWLAMAFAGLSLSCGDGGSGVPQRRIHCTADDQCGTGRYCSDSTCTDYGLLDALCWEGTCLDAHHYCNHLGMCAQRAPGGGECDARLPCTTGFECGAEGYCVKPPVPPAGVLEPCDAEVPCQDGLTCVDSVCRMPAAAGEDCSPELACYAGLVCVQGKCAAEGEASGQPCRPDGTCNADADLACAKDGHCVLLGTAGSPCLEGKSCLGSLFCNVENYCRELEPLGNACKTDGDCLSGACDVPLINAASGGVRACVRRDPRPADAGDGYKYCGNACNQQVCQVFCGSCEEISYYNGLSSLTYAVCGLKEGS